ncbi:MAG: threonine ammonia-lyase [Alphaproteobacteria bacterium]
MILPTLADVEAAAARLAGHHVRTPLFHAPLLSERLGAQVLIKPECMQRTGSFKFRGAFNAVFALGEQAKAGIIACSSGNHAQGIAEAARLAKVAATIVMPADAPAAKRERTLASGATIVPYDRATEDRDQIAAELVTRTGGVLIHPYNNAMVIAGQGTVGLEIAADSRRDGLVPDFVFVPCSGGGLGAGINLGLSDTFFDTTVVLCEPEGFDDYRQSLAAGEIIANTRSAGSVCDALLTLSAGAIGFAINSARSTQAVAISDGAAMAAAGLALERWRLVVEPSGAAGLAALLSGKVPIAGKTVVVVLSGGNVDLPMIDRLLSAYRASDLV